MSKISPFHTTSHEYFIDFVIELVNNGEPTGKHFAAQIKGYEDPTGGKPFGHSFKVKHLNYYLNDCQHPVVLFLINVTTNEGFWVFPHKLFKGGVLNRIPAGQKSLKVNFLREDNITNVTKFKYALIDAERLVRDLHPGSPIAAIQKRKADLEAIDHRFSVEIDVTGGREQIVIQPKEGHAHFRLHEGIIGLDYQMPMAGGILQSRPEAAVV